MDINFQNAPFETTMLIIGIVVLSVALPALRIRSKIKSLKNLEEKPTKRKPRQSK